MHKLERMSLYFVREAHGFGIGFGIGIHERSIN